MLTNVARGADSDNNYACKFQDPALVLRAPPWKPTQEPAVTASQRPFDALSLQVLLAPCWTHTVHTSVDSSCVSIKIITGKFRIKVPKLIHLKLILRAYVFA